MEVTRDQYKHIHDLAHDLFCAISDTMDTLKIPEFDRLPESWHELHELMSLAGVISGQAGRYRDRAELPAGPIDLTVALPAGDANARLAYEARLLAGAPDCAPFPWER